VSCSASGLPADRDEALGLSAVFGERLRTLPIAAVKGQLGEALGASGAYQAMAAIGAFASGQLPGIAGLEEVEPGLGLGDSRAPARAVAARQILITARGLDGQTAALVLGAPSGRY
jgi:3-oxoacyl-[acyl-carrier-protein] synthase II